MSYCKNCGTQLPTDAKFCPNCGVLVAAAPPTPMETHRTLKITGKPKVTITNMAPGSVEVKADPRNEVKVDLNVSAPQDLDSNITQEGNAVTIRCRARIRPLHWPSYIFTGGPRANIVVSVPVESDLDVEARFDQLAVTGIKGNIVANSSVARIIIQDCEGAVKATGRTGPINIRNVNGSISVRNSTGPVDLENANGTVSVHNSTGSITFSGALAKDENWFRTSTGSIDINLLGEPDLIVEASTRLGQITCSPELTDPRYERGLYTGRIGAGTGKLIAETTTGSIRVRK
jgi:hypothetical protein